VRVRVRYRKQGRLRFISAIDVGRVWERSLRRADLPIAYSEGFSPHPKVSFTDALPLGSDSTGEYAELTFAGPIDLPSAVRALNAAFPEGMDVLTAVPVEDGAPKFSKSLQASVWDVTYPDGTDPASAVEQAGASTVLVVPRERKGEAVDVDIRPALAHLSSSGTCVRVTVHHADHLPAAVSVAIRPSEVDAALRMFTPDLPQPVLITRLAQGRPETDGLVEALTGERIEPLSPQPQRQSL
jgi:radical SAM-linked protein